MTLFYMPTGEPVVRVAVMKVAFLVEVPDDKAADIVRRVVPAGARHHQPDGTFVISRARQQALVHALEADGYRVDVMGVGV